MAQVNVRIDDELKNRADVLFDDLGLNMSTAINMFVRQAVREGGIPFGITTKPDPFYNDENMRVLKKAMKAADAGRLTPHELIED